MAPSSLLLLVNRARWSPAELESTRVGALRQGGRAREPDPVACLVQGIDPDVVERTEDARHLGGAVGAKEVVEEAAMDVDEGAVRILHVLDIGESLSEARFSARLEVLGDPRERLCRRNLRVMITSVVS